MQMGRLGFAVFVAAASLGLSAPCAAGSVRDHFIPAGSGEVRMREPGFSCPEHFASLERDAIKVLDERPEFLDLSCHYVAAQTSITVLVTPLPGADFQDELRAAERFLRRQTGLVGK